MNSMAAKIGQLIMVGFGGLRPPRHISHWLASGRIGGVYLFARNVASPAQVKGLIAECRAAAKQPILVGIDQEGGAVARLRDGFTESPGAMALGAAGDRQLAEDVAYMMGRELAALGINWNFAPVADIAHQRANPSIGTRSVGRDPQLVSELVAAQIRGFQRAGVAATAKHFPGLGNTVIDTHDAPVKSTGSLYDLYQEELAPFRAAIAADVGCIMLTHVIYDELDTERPATLSPRIASNLLRDELGYDGVVCTDCMEMKAITDAFGAGESAALAIEAGVDMALFSHTRAAQEAAYAAVLEAAINGRLSAERIHQSAKRIQQLKRRFPLNGPPPIEIVGSDAHRSLAARAARAGIALLKNDKAIPLDADSARVFLIEFSSVQDSERSAEVVPSQFAAYLSRRLPVVKCVTMDPSLGAENHDECVGSMAMEADSIILVTRNAHMQPAQLQLAQRILERVRKLILVCARNPYDAGLLNGADTIICTNGDSKASMLAAVDAICGDFIPTGRLTVEI